MAEKTEKPTKRKLKRSRKEGQVFYSKEIGLLFFFVLIMPCLGMYFFFNSQAIKDMFQVSFLSAFNLDPYSVNNVFKTMSNYLILYLFVPVFVISVITALSIAAQVGLMFTTKSVSFNFEKISPKTYFNNMFSIKFLFSNGMMILKVICILALFFFLTKKILPQIMTLTYADISYVSNIVFYVFIFISAVMTPIFVLIAIADYLFEKIFFMHKQKMEKHEYKREAKEDEGDPEIKGKRKEIIKENIEEDLISRILSSSVIVTNPTHIAIGLYHDRANNNLPRVLFKSKDYRALKVRKIAESQGIPIIENVPLARHIYSSGQIDHEIPSEVVNMVAEVFSIIYSKSYS